MRILADTDVPEEYVSAFRGADHDVIYSRDIDRPGPETTDDAISKYAEREGFVVLSTDETSGGKDARVPVFVASRGMMEGEVRAAVSRS